MKISYHKGTYAMDSLNFKLGGVPFLITGTRNNGKYYEVDIKNINTGKTFTYEHQRLCRAILHDQEQQAKRPKIKKETTQDGRLF